MSAIVWGFSLPLASLPITYGLTMLSAGARRAGGRAGGRVGSLRPSPPTRGGGFPALRGGSGARRQGSRAAHRR
jgi:hypothetical protein